MGEPLSLQQALQRMRDLDHLDRTAIWPGGEIPQWVTDDMANAGVEQTSVTPVLWAINSWPQIARTLRTEVQRLRTVTKAARNIRHDCCPEVRALNHALNALDQTAPGEVER